MVYGHKQNIITATLGDKGTHPLEVPEMFYLIALITDQYSQIQLESERLEKCISFLS